MSKLLILFAVTALAAAVFVVPESMQSGLTTSGASIMGTDIADQPTNVDSAILSPLEEARDSIQDEDIGQYYDSLTAKYDLNNLTALQVRADNSNTEDKLPDIEKIQTVAVMLPLEEAGKNIRDAEIAEFYYKFLNGIGLKIQDEP